MATSSRVLLPMLLAACGAPEAPARHATPLAPGAAAPPMAPPPSAAPAAAPAAAPSRQVFAEADPGYAFTDPDRHKKLVAALPALDAAVAAEMARQNLPGFAIGVVIDGVLEYEKGFGVTDLETKARPDGDTVYRIGSITKSFAALALLAMRDAGKLDLDDPLARWIPEASGLVYPSRDSRPITLRQLHAHTSGLPRVGTYDGDNGPSEETIVRSLPGLALDLAPDAEWRYSNLAYSLLGIVVGRAAGEPFHDVVAKHILVPLGMTSTVWSHDDVPAGRLATAYEVSQAGLARTQPVRRGAGSARGGIYSTVRDMGRYVAWQLSAYPPRSDRDDGPIRRATLREAHSTGIPMSGWGRLEPAPKPGEPLIAYSASTYGFGWIREQSCDFDDLVTHSGSIDSYRAQIALSPSRGVGVVVLTNFAHSDPNAIARRALAELARTGALAKRVPRLSDAFPAAMQKLLAVQNQWDDAAYKAMIDPVWRSRLVEDRAELAGYKDLHGACRSFAPLHVASPTSARFKVECDRGALELDVSISSSSGLVTSFVGTSRGVAPPAGLRAQADAIVALIGKWDDGLHRRLLSKTKRSRADAQQYFADLRATQGACRIKGAVREALDWRMELDCDRGGGAALQLSLRDHDPAALDDYRVAPAGGGCPRR
ncbi:MAG TPA: serine hydrolase domain-containing protein [Kofleriaceae bacterium]|nr:serine hydrolase domain-containing protein [Kofleriaceae bacterium]